MSAGLNRFLRQYDKICGTTSSGHNKVTHQQMFALSCLLSWYAHHTYWQHFVAGNPHTTLTHHFVTVPFTNALCRGSVV